MMATEREEQIRAAALIYAQVFTNERTLDRSQITAKAAANAAVIGYLELMKVRFP